MGPSRPDDLALLELEPDLVDDFPPAIRLDQTVGLQNARARNRDHAGVVQLELGLIAGLVDQPRDFGAHWSDLAPQALLDRHGRVRVLQVLAELADDAVFGESRKRVVGYVRVHFVEAEAARLALRVLSLPTQRAQIVVAERERDVVHSRAAALVRAREQRLESERDRPLALGHARDQILHSRRINDSHQPGVTGRGGGGRDGVCGVVAPAAGGGMAVSDSGSR